MRADEPSETGLSMHVGISVRGDVFSTPLMCPHCDATRLPVSEATAQTDTEDTGAEERECGPHHVDRVDARQAVLRAVRVRADSVRVLRIDAGKVAKRRVCNSDTFQVSEERKSAENRERVIILHQSATAMRPMETVPRTETGRIPPLTKLAPRVPPSQRDTFEPFSGQLKW